MIILHWVHVLTSSDQSIIQLFWLPWKPRCQLLFYVIWVFEKSKEDIRLNFVLVSTKLIWTLVNMIAKHF